jgi:putative addiction module component (TIGR02574 family)
MVEEVSMLETYDQVMQAALNLPEEQRVLVAEALMGSVQSATSQAWHDAWLAEIKLRSREFDEAGSPGIPWEEVKANARRRIERG